MKTDILLENIHIYFGFCLDFHKGYLIYFNITIVKQLLVQYWVELGGCHLIYYFLTEVGG